MSIVASDGLSLTVGDGAATECFSALRGAEITRFEISQRLADNPAISSDAWNIGSATFERRATIDCDMVATDEAAAQYVRSSALAGTSRNFQLHVSPTQTLSFTAYVTHYREVIQAGAIKRIHCRLESSAAVTVG